MTPHLYLIECLTNLHVGSGETNYNIIDNEVERDPVLANVPIIPASGVKGALLEHCRDVVRVDEAVWHYVFGWHDKKANQTEAGAYKFFTANLLARPLRVSQGTRSYILATTYEILEQLKRLTCAVGISGYENLRDDIDTALKIPCTDKAVLAVEGRGTVYMESDTALQALLPENDYCVVESFRDFALPVLARNKLEDGISRNLWYEEVVPHKSIFYMLILQPDFEGQKQREYFDLFDNAITQKSPVQFGGNASIGCGFTRVTKVV